eukprot:363441-Chlamydomonas_euryale.AAC.4
MPSLPPSGRNRPLCTAARARDHTVQHGAAPQARRQCDHRQPSGTPVAGLPLVGSARCGKLLGAEAFGCDRAPVCGKLLRGEASGCGRLPGVGGFRMWEASGCGRLPGVGGFRVWEASGCGKMLSVEACSCGRAPVCVDLLCKAGLLCSGGCWVSLGGYVWKAAVCCSPCLVACQPTLRRMAACCPASSLVQSGMRPAPCLVARRPTLRLTSACCPDSPLVQSGMRPDPCLVALRPLLTSYSGMCPDPCSCPTAACALPHSNAHAGCRRGLSKPQPVGVTHVQCASSH